MKRFLLRILGIDYVYIVLANEGVKMKECKVFLSQKKAKEEAEALREIYGGKSVCLASRRIGHNPTRIA